MKTGKENKINHEIISEPLSEGEMLDFDERILNSNTIQIIMDLMKKNNIRTQKELADKLGVSAPYISELFAGDKKINLSLLSQLQRIFKIRFKIVTSEMVIKVPKPNSVPRLYISAKRQEGIEEYLKDIAMPKEVISQPSNQYNLIAN
jgi:predicted transcriptional regulator